VGELQTLLEILPAAVWIGDATCDHITGNRTAYELMGLPVGTNVSVTAPEVPSGAHLGFRYCAGDKEIPVEDLPMRAAVRRRKPVKDFEQDLVFDDGRVVTIQGSAAPLFDDQGKIRGVVAACVEITAHKRAKERLAHQASHDALTGLPNRVRLGQKMEQVIASARVEDSAFALLVLDLDGFKQINDTFGHHSGDATLQRVCPRLRHAVRESDQIARLGGDEFGILLPGADETVAVEVADRILEGLAQPILVAEQPLEVGASIGIALYPVHGRDGATLLKHADHAMYAAKRCRIGWAVYVSDPEDLRPQPLSLVGELRQALAENQFLLYYQPKLDLRTMRLDGAEALVRWQHPHDGLIPAAEFLPLAERTGLIRPLSHWALEAALRQYHDWHQAGWFPQVAVNLAPDHLHDEHLARTMIRLLEEAAAPPESLTVEVTEAAIMADPLRVKAVLGRVHELGVRIAIDDFGTGYSSLVALKELPVDELKLDRTLVKDLATDERDGRLVRSVIELGHSLGFRVVAEGVEDQVALDRLADWGCDQAQGYYFSRPLTATDLPSWMTASLDSGAPEACPLLGSRGNRSPH
jgi:diguanylate cyclase (GGDEF)-like protein